MERPTSSQYETRIHPLAARVHSDISSFTLPDSCTAQKVRRLPDALEPGWQPQPSGENIMLFVSNETHDRTTADSVRPSAENKHTTVRSDHIVVGGVIERVWTRVVDIADLAMGVTWRRRASVQNADIPSPVWAAEAAQRCFACLRSGGLLRSPLCWRRSGGLSRLLMSDGVH